MQQKRDMRRGANSPAREQKPAPEQKPAQDEPREKRKPIAKPKLDGMEHYLAAQQKVAEKTARLRAARLNRDETSRPSTKPGDSV
jgi:hypothetical protein